jgi:23S rRNA (guanosine2251-2'-O)-methyltransferase
VVLEAVRSGRASEVLLARGARETPALRELLDACGAAGIEPREVTRVELDRLAPGNHGVAARIRPPEPIGERELAAWPFGDRDLVVALDGIVDPHNLGAAARSAEAAGAAMLITRVHRAADVTSAAVAASAGALLHLPRARVANIPRSLVRLRDAGFTIVGLDERAERTVYEEPCPDGRIALAIGSEGSGLARLTREACDLLVRLPMRGHVGSLNASASLAAALYAYVLPFRAGGGA